MNFLYKLLIVDDERNIVEGIRRILDWKKYRITYIYTATSYDEAVSVACEKKPDIVILDVCIDNVLGHKVIERLGELGLSSKYVMVSGHSDFHYVRRAMLLDVRDYILKPIDVKELEAVVTRILTRDFGEQIAVDDNKRVYGNGLRGDIIFDFDKLSGIVIRVIVYTEENFMRDIKLSSIAQTFKMNGTYLGQLFFKETGIRFSHFLLAYRMEKAKELIQTTDNKIAVICSMVGYENLNYFYKHFKEFYGVSPTEFRAS